MELDFPLLLISFVAISLLVTYLIKRFTKHETHTIISLIKTKKPLPLFDAAAKHKKFLDAFAWMGMVFGFGAISLDYLYGRKLPIAKRLVLFLGSFSVLSGIFIVFDSVFLGSALSSNPMLGPLYPLVVFSFAAMGLSGFTLFSLALQAHEILANMLIGKSSCPGVAPLIPGVEIPGVPITPPIHAWISLLIILIVHEGMHGVLGRRHNFKIKSTGVLLFGFMPIGAFVEPDEAELKKGEDHKVLSFLAAGPMANIALMVVSGILLFGMLLAVTPVTDYLYPGIQDNFFSGVKVNSVLDHTEFCGEVYASSALGALQPGDEIKEVNGAEITTLTDLFIALQENKLSEKTFLLQRGAEEVSVSIAPNSLGQFGFVPEGMRNPDLYVPDSYFTYAIYASILIEFVYWLFLLNFLVASINFLPLSPFDGGRMARILFSPYISFLKKPEEELRAIVGKVFFALIIALFIINALPLFI